MAAKSVKSKSLISIIVPCFNEEDNIPELLRNIEKVLQHKNHEIILINDGSSDGTLLTIESLVKSYPQLKYLSFSRNFGHQASLRAGLTYAKGDSVISMDADLQHPPELLPKLIEKWLEGYEIVYTRRDDEKSESISFFKKKSSAAFYKLMNKLSGLKIDPGAADFRLLDRKVVDIINTFPEPDLFLRGLINWIGFKSIAIDYVPAERFAGQSKYSIKKMMSFALNGITQFSIKPLRLTVIIGCFMAAVAIIYAGYTVFDYLLGNNTVSGWTSLIITVLLTSGIQLILLGVVGEYVGKAFMQTKGRPDYIVSQTNIDIK